VCISHITDLPNNIFHAVLQPNRWRCDTETITMTVTSDDMAFKWISLNRSSRKNADYKGVFLFRYNCRCACAGAGLESMWKFPQAPHKGRKWIQAVSITATFHRGGRKWSQRTETSETYDLLLPLDMNHGPPRICKLSYMKQRREFLRPQEAESLLIYVLVY
jgi:hypothetical protein